MSLHVYVALKCSVRLTALLSFVRGRLVNVSNVSKISADAPLSLETVHQQRSLCGNDRNSQTGWVAEGCAICGRRPLPALKPDGITSFCQGDLLRPHISSAALLTLRLGHARIHGLKVKDQIQ